MKVHCITVIVLFFNGCVFNMHTCFTSVHIASVSLNRERIYVIRLTD